MNEEYGKDIEELFERLKNDESWEKDAAVREQVAMTLWFQMEGQTR